MDGSSSDPYSDHIEGTASLLDGTYIQSGTTVSITLSSSASDFVIDGSWGLTIETCTGYFSGVQVLTGTVEGRGTLTVSTSGGNETYTFHVIDTSASYSELEFLSDPVADATLVYGGP